MGNMKVITVNKQLKPQTPDIAKLWNCGTIVFSCSAVKLFSCLRLSCLAVQWYQKSTFQKIKSYFNLFSNYSLYFRYIQQYSNIKDFIECCKLQFIEESQMGRLIIQCYQLIRFSERIFYKILLSFLNSKNIFLLRIQKVFEQFQSNQI